MEKDWVLIYSTGEAYKANILGELLAENNILFDILDKKDSSFLVGDVEVYVNAKDEVKALEIVKNFNV